MHTRAYMHAHTHTHTHTHKRIQTRAHTHRRRIAGGTRDADEEERCGSDDAVLIHARNHPEEEVRVCADE